MNLLWPIAISIAFGIGMVLMFFLIRISRWKREKESLMQAHPEEPWRWKKDWAKGKIRSSSRNFYGMLFFSGVWILLSVPFLLTFRDAPHTIFKIVIVAFGICDVFLLFAVSYMFLRWLKYGRSVLEMASVPGVIGGQFAGVVRTSAKIRVEDVFRLRLRCIHSEARGKGDSRRLHHYVIWEDEQLIAYDLLQHDGGRSAIPFLFQIPYECRQTGKLKSEDYIEWKLGITAKTPGVDYRSEFEVPIFKTAQSDPDFVVDQSLIEKYTTPEDPERDLREARVRRTISSNGEDRFIFPMARQLGTAMVMIVMTVVFWGVPVFFFHHGFHAGTAFLSVIFSLFGILLLYLSLDMCFYRSVVDVSPRGLRVKGGLFGGRTRRWIDLSDLNEIKLDCNMKSEQQKHYDIVAICSDGRKVILGKRIPGQRLANAVQQQIEDILLKEA